MRLDNNVILITGGGTGIGRALALKLVAMNNTVIICGRRPEKLEETRTLDERLIAYPCDAADDTDIDRLCRKLDNDGHKVNILINNAAVLNHYNFAKPETFSIKTARGELDCNIAGPIALTMALLPSMLQTQQPCIINVGSPGGIVAVSPTPLYSISKAGLHAFTQILRLHLKNRVRVIEVFPPTVKTDMTTRIRRKQVSAESCVDAIITGLSKDKAEVWVGEGRVVRWLMNLLPPSWVFALVNSQPSMRAE